MESEAVPGDDSLAVAAAQDPASMKRIEIDLVAGFSEANDEVTGQANSVNPQPGIRSDDQIDEAEGYGNARPAIDYLVDEAVRRVVIVVGIAAKPQLRLP